MEINKKIYCGDRMRMEWDKVYKIKDSIDIYLVDNEYIMIYFMNTRQRKKYRVNQAVIKLFEEIDGKKTLSEIYESFSENETIEKELVEKFFEKMLEDKIISKKLDEHILSEEYLMRYDRQINYFSEFLGSEMEAELAQKRLIDARIGIIGCGSVGGNIAIQLAMAGVENFVLMDCDSVEESDIARHIYYSKTDVGKKKVEVLSDKLKKINKKIKTYISYNALLPTTNMQTFVEKVDFVVNTADEPYLGYTANIVSQLCVPEDIPHYIAGGFDAHLASTGELVIPHVTPCAACYSTFFEKKLVDWIPEKHPVKVRQNEMGGLASMTLFSSSYACIEIIKFISGIVDMKINYQKRAEFYFDGMELVYLEPTKNPECKVCGGKSDEI